MPKRELPERDKRAVRHPAPEGAGSVARTAGVVGGGIAGIAAAVGLAERGVKVTLYEAGDRLGGRVAAWPLGDGRTMSRGFHAFFRQYYNLRALLRRVDPTLSGLTAVPDYPLVAADGRVLGVVFATDLRSSDTGYVLTSGEVAGDFAQGRDATARVGTGDCTPG